MLEIMMKMPMMMSCHSQLQLLLLISLLWWSFDWGTCSYDGNDLHAPEGGNFDKAHLMAQAAAAAASNYGAASAVDFSNDMTMELQRSLRIEPPQLDFGVWSVGTVRSFTVTLINENANRSVYVSSMSGRTPIFYSRYFEAKIVPPHSNATFNVVFLPREKGAVSTNLHIHTTFGALKLAVRGEGRACPYRLKPIVGLKAPLNATLIPEIQMFNPHERPLQILEAYSSNEKFQLELPNDASDGLWEIAPFTTKPVIRIRFQAVNPGNHSAYIRIKIAEYLEGLSKPNENVLVIPVEFQIMPDYGIYVENPLIDFGYVAVNANTEPIIRQIQLRHSKSNLNLTSIRLLNEKLAPGIRYDTVKQQVILNLQDLTEQQNYTSISQPFTLSLAYKTHKSLSTHHKVELLIRCDAFRGDLHYEQSSTVFALSSIAMARKKEERRLTVTNYFQQPLLIFNVSIWNPSDAALHIRTKSLAVGVVLKPLSSLDLMEFHFGKKDGKTLTNFKTFVYVYTNLTRFKIPIVICSGQLHVFVQTDSKWHTDSSVPRTQLNLGSRLQTAFIILQNRNPLTIKIHNWNMQTAERIRCSIKFHGCLKFTSARYFNYSTMIDLLNTNFTIHNELAEGDVGVFSVDLQPYAGSLVGINDLTVTQKIMISTYFENITVTMKLFISNGRLEVDQEKLHFENCFPGKLCSSELSIRSTYTYPIQVHSINFTEAALTFVPAKEGVEQRIAPGTTTAIGHIYFRPSHLCGARCYIPENTAEEIAFPSNLNNCSNNVPQFDETELRRRIELYRHFKWYFQSIDFILTTKDAYQFPLNIIIELKWPKLVISHQVLPDTEITKSTDYTVTVNNPSDKPLLVDYVLSDPALAQHTQLSLPLEVVIIAAKCYLTDRPVFSLVRKMPQKPILIPPGGSIAVPIRFNAQTCGTYCTLLHMRNNLTLYEAVWLSAKTIQSQFQFGNRRPGSSTPLLFDFSEPQLKYICSLNTDQYMELDNDNILPKIFTRRIFTARNSGQVSIWINSILIGDQPCEGYGFKVTDCQAFELKPNSSRRIEITFRPDFTSMRVVRPLILRTNHSVEFHYVIVAQMPPKVLDHCMAQCSRPLWESRIRSAAIVILGLTFILVHVAVHFDYNNILYRQSILYGSRDKQQLQPTFNLRNLAVRNATATATDGSTICDANNSKTKDKFNINSTCSNLKKRNISKTPKGVSSNGMSKPLVKNVANRNMSLANMMNWSFNKSTTRKSTSTAAVATSSKSEKTTLVLPITKPSILTDNADNINANRLAKMRSNEKGLEKNSEKTEAAFRKQIPSAIKLNNSRKHRTDNSNDEWLTEKETSKKDRNQNKVDVKSTVKKPNTPSAPLSSSAPSSPSTQSSTSAGSSPKLTTNSAIMLTTTPPTVAATKETIAPGRKLGKTPGRERKKQMLAISETAQAASSSLSSSYCYSNYLGASQSSTNNNRKDKPKAFASLKFPNLQTQTSTLVDNADVGNITKSLNFANSLNDNPYMTNCITSPWDTNSPVTFRDVLQLPISTKSTQSSSEPKAPALQTYTSIADFTSLNKELSTSKDDSELTSFLTQRKPNSDEKISLGPIGSKKSPSSTPNWESSINSVSVETTHAASNPIKPYTLKTSNAQTPNVNTPTDLLVSSIISNTTQPTFGLNNMSPATQLHQPIMSHAIVAPTAEIKMAQDELDRLLQASDYLQTLRKRQILAQQQQHENSHNTWMHLNGGGGTWGNEYDCRNLAGAANASAVNFTQTPQSNNVWNLNSTAVLRPPPGLENNFALNSNLSNQRQQVPNRQHQQHHSAMIASVDEMPIFDPFGLSSIWVNSWKQQEQQDQQQQQKLVAPATSNAAELKAVANLVTNLPQQNQEEKQQREQN